MLFLPASFSKPLKAPSHLWALLLIQAAACQFALAAAPGFNAEIRPILSEFCFECHGPDAQQRKSGLRLDTHEGAVADLGHGAAVVPGQPSASLLLERVTSQDPDEVMPPPSSGKQVSPEQIESLRRWIAQGASYQGHWSYELPQRPPLPHMSDVGIGLLPQSDHPVDRFVLNHLAGMSQELSGRADPYLLARRVALDLTGLPPRVEEVDAFVADHRPDAFERFVDQLLRKPSYGEHWARWWLDQARYADSAGYADDPPRTIWAFRDYVINSFNANLPFDQFTIEQLAGDLLENPTDAQLVATAFHRNTMTNNEGGTSDEEFRNVAVIDRVNTTWAVWMGTTMACAQCHHHKYDPISQEEYFQFFDLMNQTQDADRRDESPVLELFTEAQLERKSSLRDQHQKLTAVLSNMTDELRQSFELWQEGLTKPVSWSSSERRAEPWTLNGQVQGSDNLLQVSSRQPQSLGLNWSLKPAQDGEIYGLAWTWVYPESAAVEPLELELTVPRITWIPSQDKPPAGRYLRIVLPGSQRMLSLAEVQLFSGEENIALGASTSQSSTDFGGVSSRAVDGNTEGDYHASQSVTHTATSDDPWWELDLGEVKHVDRLVIWNRTDGSLHRRLDGAKILWLDAQRQELWQLQLEQAPSVSEAWAIEGRQSVGLIASRRLVEDANGPWTQDWDANTLNLLPGQRVRFEVAFEQPVMAQEGGVISLQSEAFKLNQPASLNALLETSQDGLLAQQARFPDNLWAILHLPEDRRQADQRDALSVHYLALAPSLAKERQQLAQVEEALKSIKPYTSVPIMKTVDAGKERTTHVQRRGNFMDLGEVVKAGIPAIFTKHMESAPQDRLAMARWLVSRSNPLTARVMVNRMWEAIFGQGLVSTSEEFGSQGNLPTHPALLDWLAVEFMDSGWDIKHMLKLIVTSHTYSQSSKWSQSALEIDAGNRWLGRGQRVRLSAESIRDQALQVSGLLSQRLLGPSVNPPQPEMGLNAAFGSKIDWQTSQGQDRYRRGLYTTWRRSNPYPSMAVFDAPNREVCTLRRDRSNTPLQALVTLNDPAFVEAAQGLARRMHAAGDQLEDRLAFGLRQCLIRHPLARELQSLESLYGEALAYYQSSVDQAKLMAEDPIGPLAPGAEAPVLASLTVVANAILNLDEFLMKP